MKADRKLEKQFEASLNKMKMHSSTLKLFCCIHLAIRTLASALLGSIEQPKITQEL